MKKEIMPKDMCERVQKLEFYSNLQNDEYGEGCDALVNLWYRSDMLDTDFMVELNKEITKHLQNILDNTEIKEELYTPSSYTITKLEWKDE